MRNRNFFIYFIMLTMIWALLLVPVSVLGKTKNGKRSPAATKYVSDTLAITLRSGKSNQHRIIRSLESGTKLRVLGTDKNYTQVKTANGEKGWVLTRYLVDKPVARSVLPGVQEKLTKLESQHAELTKKFKEVNKERKELARIAAKYEKLDNRHQKLTEEAARLRKVAGESDEIFKKNQALSKSTAILQAEKDVLMEEIRELRNGNNKLWFLTGAGVIFVGILIGAMLARSRKPKSSSWASGSDTLMLRQP